MCGTKRKEAYRLRSVQKTDEPVTDTDWRRIIALPFTKPQRLDLANLSSEHNPGGAEDIFYASEINEVLADANMNFRVMVSQNAVLRRRTPRLHKMYKVVARMSP